jgi:7,8-dihydroneopterin aldolase/epimerase/oxygenase
MLTVSLHGIKLHAKVGLYPEEKIKGNDFEVDVDIVTSATTSKDFPFLDYTIIHKIVKEAFEQEGELLETFVKNIHSALKEEFFESEKVRVAIRKLNPPLGDEVRYSQVSFEA